MSIEYADVSDLEDVMHLYDRAEREGIEWLMSRNPQWRELKVKRRTSQQFDLLLTGCAVGNGSSATFYNTHFKIMCVREFSRMGLVGPAECAGRTNHEVFDHILSQRKG